MIDFLMNVLKIFLVHWASTKTNNNNKILDLLFWA